uniref:Uncharacterized protein n=1 Tax=Avena sativa TaxID=4498 RepID=A0ACD5W9A9_AVESA
MTHHRSPRQNPQIDSREEVAVMPRRRSPGLHPQIPASGDDVGTTRHVRRRRGKSPAAPESLPFNEEMLREILLRLPLQSSSLLRASVVCKHWRGLVTEPRFLRRFRAHQRKPPLLGVFVTRAPGIKFRSILGPPDRIPPERFDLRRQTCCRTWTVLLGCRHGRVLHLDYKRHKVIVCDPVTCEHHHVDAPPVFRGSHIDGAVLCAATDQGHLHGSCHSSPFKVVLICLIGNQEFKPIACVYSSETGVWGNIIAAADRCWLHDSNPGLLIGNILYWSSKSVNTDRYIVDMDFTEDMLEFDLDRQSLAVTKGPACLNGSLVHQKIIQAEDGAVGLLMKGICPERQ